jgi:hypothetical protein
MASLLKSDRNCIGREARMSATDVLTNPFVVTLTGGLITAVVSVYLSGRFGERAAANYSIKQGRKRDHHLALLDKPADELITEAGDDRRFYNLGIDYYAKPRAINTRVFPDLEEGQKRERSETDFLISHLETGYADIFVKLKELRQKRNKAIREVAKIAQEMTNQVTSAQLLPSLVLGRAPQPDWIDPLVVAQDFANISRAHWENETYNKPPIMQRIHDQLGDGWTVSWEYQVARTREENKALEIKNMLELMTRSEYYDRLVEVFKENEGLSSLGRPIQEALEGLRIKVKAGVPLKGSCVAGQEAEPKFE